MASTVATRHILDKHHEKISAIAIAKPRVAKTLDRRVRFFVRLARKHQQFLIYKVIESVLYNIYVNFISSFGIRERKYRNSTTIDQLAKTYGIPVILTNTVNDEAFLSRILEFQPDFILCSITQRLTRQTLEFLGDKFINAHGSCLPRYRGPAQYFWYLYNNESQFGATLHFMDSGLDTGDIIFQKTFNVENNISAYRLHYQIANVWGALFVQFIDVIVKEKNVSRIRQNDNESTFTVIPSRQDARRFRSLGYRWITLRDFFSCV